MVENIEEVPSAPVVVASPVAVYPPIPPAPTVTG
jgi:hypothetical protein